MSILGSCQQSLTGGAGHAGDARGAPVPRSGCGPGDRSLESLPSAPGSAANVRTPVPRGAAASFGSRNGEAGFHRLAQAHVVGDEEVDSGEERRHARRLGGRWVRCERRPPGKTLTYGICPVPPVGRLLRLDDESDALPGPSGASSCRDREQLPRCPADEGHPPRAEDPARSGLEPSLRLILRPSAPIRRQPRPASTGPRARPASTPPAAVPVQSQSTPGALLGSWSWL